METSRRAAAELLRRQKARIIEDWTLRCLEKVPAAQGHSRHSIVNSLPDFLEQLAKTLEAPESDRELEINAEIACEHGEERASLGTYSMEQLVYEYQLLRDVLTWHLDLERPLTASARKIIHSFVDQGMAQSTARFGALVNRHSAEMMENLQRARAEVEAERKHLFDFFMQAPIPLVILMGAEHHITLANQPYENLIGQKVAGKTMAEVFSPEDGRIFLPLLDAVYNTGIPFSGKGLPLELTGPGGELYQNFLNVDYQPFLESNGKIQGILAIVQNVTAEQQAKRKTEASEARFRVLCEQSPQIIWMADASGKLTFLSQHWFDLTGVLMEDAADRGWKNVLHEDDIAKTVEAYERSIRTGEDYDTEHRFRRQSDGKYIWYNSRARAVKDHKGDIREWVGLATDIDSQKTLVQKLEKERELREHFVASLTHDLRVPLSSAKMSAQLLQRQHPDQPPVLDLAERIVASVDRSESMIQNLLDVSRVKAGEKIPVHFEPCRLDQVVEAVVVAAREIHGERVHFVNKAPPEIVLLDCQAIRRVVENLLSNALKYGQTRTPITVSLRSEGPYLTIEVHNQGNPISPEDHAVLFEAFHRSASAMAGGQKGWGLGLMLVKAITEAHNGTITLRSDPEEGTTFTVCLPKDPHLLR